MCRASEEQRATASLLGTGSYGNQGYGGGYGSQKKTTTAIKSATSKEKLALASAQIQVKKLQGELAATKRDTLAASLKIKELEQKVKAAKEAAAVAKPTSMRGCPVTKIPGAPNPARVDTKQADFPARAVLQLAGPHVVVTGYGQESITCTLRGVVTFQASGGHAEAQLDPNYRDPRFKSPLCHPMATMLFFAGVVDDDTGPIRRHVALQIEPHGRIRVIGKEARDIKVRLDGVTFSPFMRFNKPNPSCAAYCFPTVKPGKSGAKMSASGCVKYCTPPEMQLVAGKLQPVPCRCDMMKRLECFKREGSSKLVCGQFKQLIRAHTLAKGTVDMKVCGEVCARQLTAL